MLKETEETVVFTAIIFIIWGILIAMAPPPPPPGYTYDSKEVNATQMVVASWLFFEKK